VITMGTLGDRIGRRRLLLIGAAAFCVASALAAFSTSARMLIATRAVLGLAGATLAPSTLSLIRNMFLDPRQRAVAIGVWISSYSAGAVIGPPLGGFLLEHFWWGSVFLARRVRPALMMGIGLVIAAVGFLALAQVDGTSGLAVIVASTVVFSVGLSPVFTLANDMIIGAAPPERAGAASGRRPQAVRQSDGMCTFAT